MGIDLSQAITAGIIAVAVPLALRGLSKAFPAKKTPIPTEKEFSSKDVQKINFIVLPLFFLFAAVAGGLVWLILLGLYDVYKSMIGTSEMFIGPPTSALSLPALFSGILASCWPLSIVMRRILKDRYELYIQASSRQYGGMDSNRVMTAMTSLIVPLVILGSAAIFHSKIVIFSDRMNACGLISCLERPFLEISEIGLSTHAKAPNGNIVSRRDFYLRFKDGSVWSPFLLSGDLPLQTDLANVLSGKTGLKVNAVDLLPEN